MPTLHSRDSSPSMAPGRHPIRLSVIIPVFNEERTIIPLLEKVRSQSIEHVAFEVVVVDDGSKDKSLELLEKRPDLYDRLLKMPVNGGKGAAVKMGLGVATGDYVLFQDADLEYDPAEYSKLLRPVIEYDADVVVGSRFIAPQMTRVYYFWHRLGNKFITLIFNLFFNTTFTDIYSCYLLYRRVLVDPAILISTGWQQHAEILARAVHAGRIYFEVPISYYGRTYEEGKKIKAYHAMGVLWMIVAMRLWRRS